jgi:hypothetical protein
LFCTICFFLETNLISARKNSMKQWPGTTLLRCCKFPSLALNMPHVLQDDRVAPSHKLPKRPKHSKC